MTRVTNTTLHPGSAEEAGFQPERIQLIRDEMASWVSTGRTPSLSVLVARGGVVVLHEAMGRLTYEETSQPLSTDSVFRAASIAKLITAAATMVLVEEGLLSLNRPLRDYVPEVCGEGTEKILVHQLLTHTSGFLDDDVDELLRKRRQNEVELPPMEETQHERLHRRLNATYPLDVFMKPGERMMYCAHNFNLLGEIVRRVSGQAFNDFVTARIFQPLGMSSSSFRMDEAFEDRLVRAYPDTPDVFPDGRFNFHSKTALDTPIPSGGLKSSPSDLAIFCQTFLNGGTYGETRLLSFPTVSEMTQNQIPGVGTYYNGWHNEASWGLGWMIQSHERWPYSEGALQPWGTYYHQGSGGCGLWVDPVNEIVGVFCSVCETDEVGQNRWEFDLFQNLVTCAVAD